MGLATEVNPGLLSFINRSSGYFKGHPSFPETIQSLIENPKDATVALNCINFAAVNLNRIIESPDEVLPPQELLPYSWKIREYSERQGVRTPLDFLKPARHPNSPDARNCDNTLKQFKYRMLRGEQGETSEFINFHLLNYDHKEVTHYSALYFYIIRSMLDNPRINGYGDIFGAALAEMIIIHDEESVLMRHAIVLDKAPSLLRYIVDGVAGDLYCEGEVIRDTPNFRVTTASSGVARGERSIIIEPKSAKGNGMLLQAGTMHHSGEIVETSNNAALPSVSFPAVGEVNSRNLRVVLGGLREVPQPGVKTLPALERMEELIRSGDQIYRPQ